MKVKNKDIVVFLNGIGALKDKRFPVKVTYAINKNIRAVSGAAEAYNKTFDELRSQYMLKDVEGKLVLDEHGEPKFHEGKKDEFVKELDELREIEVDINLNMLTYSDTEKCDSEQIQYTYCERYGSTGHYAEVEEVPVCIRHQKNLET